MIPIDTQVKGQGQAYGSYVGEGGHKCFTNIYILPCDLDLEVLPTFEKL